MQRKKAFTLIELLIVVAIIAILAAIAVPNFLEAQVRAKVSRGRADMRTLVTAAEAYAVDYNTYPPAEEYNNNDPLTLEWNANSQWFHARMGSPLTTPIAYVSTLYEDPFVSVELDGLQLPTFWEQNAPNVGKRYTWFPWSYYLTPDAGGNNPNGFNMDFWDGAVEWTGQWLMYGFGPDSDAFHGNGATFLPYDPTNGTISDGNIVRTQKSTDGIPPHPNTGCFNWVNCN